VLAPTGALRAVYLAGNPVQAIRDAHTGQVSGVSADIAKELAARAEVPLQFEGLQGIAAVIDAVSEGKADIGFLAPDPSREGKVVFSQVYLRNPQSVVVPLGSPIKSLEDLKSGSFRIGVTKGDSIANFLRRNYSHLRLVEVEGASTAAALELLRSGHIDAFAANNTRLQAIAAEDTSMAQIEGSITGVPQAIAVSASNPAALEKVNAFIDAVRGDGRLQTWITKARNGTVMEPAKQN